MHDDNDIKTALKTYKRIAVVGLSPKPERPSYAVTNYMIGQGYEIVGVNPGSDRILNRPVYSSLEEVPGPLEIIDVFRNSDAVPTIVQDAIRLKAKVLWLQEGVTDPVAEDKARQAGLIVISDRCILKDHRRLLR